MVGGPGCAAGGGGGGWPWWRLRRAAPAASPPSAATCWPRCPPRPAPPPPPCRRWCGGERRWCGGAARGRAAQQPSRKHAPRWFSPRCRRCCCTPRCCCGSSGQRGAWSSSQQRAALGRLLERPQPAEERSPAPTGRPPPPASAGLCPGGPGAHLLPAAAALGGRRGGPALRARAPCGAGAGRGARVCGGRAGAAAARGRGGAAAVAVAAAGPAPAGGGRPRRAARCGVEAAHVVRTALPGRTGVGAVGRRAAARSRWYRRPIATGVVAGLRTGVADCGGAGRGVAPWRAGSGAVGGGGPRSGHPAGGVAPLAAAGCAAAAAAARAVGSLAQRQRLERQRLAASRQRRLRATGAAWSAAGESQWAAALLLRGIASCCVSAASSGPLSGGVPPAVKATESK